MKNKLLFGILIVVIILLIALGLLIFLNNKANSKKSDYVETTSKIEKKIEEAKIEKNEENIVTDKDNAEESVLNSTRDIDLHDVDGKETNYEFTYKGKIYSAKYTKDNWHIVDSYEITNKKDIEIICKALIDIYPIHGRDMISYRTVEDLAYEWNEHNIAYMVLPENNIWKKNTKDVDLNPEDQNKSLQEMYEDRTGKKLNINELIKSK